MTTFKAEAGKVYFFGEKEGVVGVGGGTTYVPPTMGSNGMGQYVDAPGNAMLVANYGFLSDDEGKYRVKAGKLATWMTK